MRRLIVPVLLTVCFITAALISPAAAAVATPKPCSNGYVSLSFDDSPTQYTPALLAQLRTLKIKATFFDVGSRAVAYPTYVKQQVAGGHVVGNHTTTHPDLVNNPDAFNELLQTEYLLIQQSGTIPTLFRPPYGSTDETVKATANQLGLTEVIWTVDTVDWSSPPVASIVAAAKTVKSGGFILMHDGYPNSITALPQIMANLTAAGLCPGKIVPSATPTNAWENRDFYATVAPW